MQTGYRKKEGNSNECFLLTLLIVSPREASPLLVKRKEEKKRNGRCWRVCVMPWDYFNQTLSDLLLFEWALSASAFPKFSFNDESQRKYLVRSSLLRTCGGWSQRSSREAGWRVGDIEPWRSGVHVRRVWALPSPARFTLSCQWWRALGVFICETRWFCSLVFRRVSSCLLTPSWLKSLPADHAVRPRGLHGQTDLEPGKGSVCRHRPCRYRHQGLRPQACMSERCVGFSSA